MAAIDAALSAAIRALAWATEGKEGKEGKKCKEGKGKEGKEGKEGMVGKESMVGILVLRESDG